MALTLMGKKRGMTQLFDKDGNSLACTVIEAEPNVVTQIKTDATDGYTAIQLGFDTVKTNDPRTVENRVSKPLRGHYKKAGIEPRRHLAESRLDAVDSYTVGQAIGVDAFEGIGFVDATAISKGKGCQGVIKRHHFAGGPAAHGSGFHRHAGSTGMRTTPGRCLPGGKKPGHMGHEQVTIQNLKVMMIDVAANVIVVEGQVPGPRNGLVFISAATKKAVAKKKK